MRLAPLLLLAFGSCSRPEPPAPAAPLAPSSPRPAPGAPTPDTPASSDAASAASAAPPASGSAAVSAAPVAFSPEQIAAFLLLEQADVQACAAAAPGPCLLARRHQGPMLDEAQRVLAESGSVLGLEAAGELDGGYRGVIKIEPQAPTGPHARHLGWVTGSLREIDAFFAWLGPVQYRWKPLGLRFFRSVNRRTPAAYAHRWEVAYNVVGGINTSADAVRETMFHEVFHLNDSAHDGWSARVLGPIFDRIVARCGARTPCLTPYAPGSTMVRGGTYYAFQPGNGVGEYAAELALRYHIEHRLVWRGEPVKRPFKCGPPENREAWRALVLEFFGGIDRVDACPERQGH